MATATLSMKIWQIISLVASVVFVQILLQPSLSLMSPSLARPCPSCLPPSLAPVPHVSLPRSPLSLTFPCLARSSPSCLPPSLAPLPHVSLPRSLLSPSFFSAAPPSSLLCSRFHPPLVPPLVPPLCLNLPNYCSATPSMSAHVRGGYCWVKLHVPVCTCTHTTESKGLVKSEIGYQTANQKASASCGHLFLRIPRLRRQKISI